MSKMNIEVMEQLLKDLAANVGYDLIPAPFDTPFEEASIEGLPDSKQFFWPVPTWGLNDKEHEEFRKMCVEADIIDTVCTTSFPWPSDENAHVAILLIDVTRRRRGCIKFVDASVWDDLSDETNMAAVCNMLIHDLFPGEHHLAFQMHLDAMDEGLDERWSEQVCLVSASKIGSSLSPRDYILRPVAKQGFKYIRLDEVFSIEDLEGVEKNKILCNKIQVDNFEELHGYKIIDNLIELNVPAIVISAYGDLQPQKAIPEKDPVVIDMNEKIVLIPRSYLEKPLDLDCCVEQLKKEMTMRQLPFLPYPDARLIEEDLMGVLIEIPEN